MLKELLVVDDEPKICRALTVLFEERGVHVVTAPSAREALEQITRVQAEVVLLDLKLPDGSGLDVLSKIKEQFPQLRVVVISALANPATIHEAFQRGASGYLTKPFDFDQCFFAAMGIEAVDLTLVRPDPQALARVPRAVAEQYRVVPIRWEQDQLQLALTDPLDEPRLEALRAALHCPIHPVAAIGGDLGEVIARWYRADSTPRAIPEESDTSSSPASAERPVSPTEASVGAKLFEGLLRNAQKHRATDLHLGLSAQGPWMRYRIDGQLVDAPVPDRLIVQYAALLDRMKALAHLDASQRHLPQQGRLKLHLSAGELDLRVSFLPTPLGENVAIRLLSPSQLLPLNELGLSPEQHQRLETILGKSSGLALVTGPSKSGLSTTLYTVLAHLARTHTNIITLEDPIERDLPRLTQVQVQPHLGLTFANGLRAALRHDPDVLMVGELADRDTTALAVRAALSGRLVVAALHTPNAASAITRLLDFEIEPFLICSALTGVLSQRLVRRLCPSCRQSVSVEPAQLASLGLVVPEAQAAVPVWQARGCAACGQSGYQGCVGLFELLTIDHQLRSLILKRTPTAQLAQSAASRGMHRLWQTGWEHVRSGITSPQELLRVLPSEPK